MGSNHFRVGRGNKAEKFCVAENKVGEVWPCCLLFILWWLLCEAINSCESFRMAVVFSKIFHLFLIHSWLRTCAESSSFLSSILSLRLGSFKGINSLKSSLLIVLFGWYHMHAVWGFFLLCVQKCFFKSTVCYQWINGDLHSLSSFTYDFRWVHILAWGLGLFVAFDGDYYGGP